MTHVDASTFAAGLAVPDDFFLFGDDQIGFGVLAGPAENEFVDKAVQKLTELGSIVSAIYNVTIVLLIEGGLRAKFTAEELGGVCGRAAERARHVGHVREDGLDTIALAFNFGKEQGHAEGTE